MRCLQYIALDAEHDFACRWIQEIGFKPIAVRLENLVSESREEFTKVDDWKLLFYNLMDCHPVQDVATSFVHLGAPLRAYGGDLQVGCRWRHLFGKAGRVYLRRRLRPEVA
jgi:hypothetical protein